MWCGMTSVLIFSSVLLLQPPRPPPALSPLSTRTSRVSRGYYTMVTLLHASSFAQPSPPSSPTSHTPPTSPLPTSNARENGMVQIERLFLATQCSYYLVILNFRPRYHIELAGLAIWLAIFPLTHYEDFFHLLGTPASFHIYSH